MQLQQIKTNYHIVLFLSLMKGADALWFKRADASCQCNSVVVHDIGLQCSLPAIRTRTVGTELSERSLGVRVPHTTHDCSLCENAHPCITFFYIA